MSWTTQQLADHPNFGKLIRVDEKSLHHRRRLRAQHAQPDGRLPLDHPAPGEIARWHQPGARFDLVFTVYARQPADWDGYDVKALQDFLVKAGVITDDRWDLVAGRVVSKKVATEAEEKTVIEIFERECL